MLPAVLRNFANSEKGIFCVALIVAASILASTGQMSVAEWQDYTKWIAGIFVGGKAIEGAAAKLAEAKKK